MEHALVFASIIVGVAVSDQIMSLNRLLLARDRVRWDWAPLAVALLALLTNVQVWWAVAAEADGAITIGGFLPILVELVLLALLSAASLPSDDAAEGLDLRHYYERERRYIWTLFVLAFGWSILSMSALQARDLADYARVLANRWADFIVLAIMATPIIVRDRRWHAVAIAILYLGPLGWLSRSLT